MAIDKVIIGNTPYYKATYEKDFLLSVVSALKVLKLEPSFSLTGGYFPSGISNATITIFYPDKTKETFNDNRGVDEIVKKVNLKEGTYRIQYKGRAGWSFQTGPTSYDTKFEDYSFSYYFGAVENKLPLKSWTVTDVINRILDLAEPLRKGEKARFRLNLEQSEKFDKILAPEFSFTKQTLRECLQEVGKFIHGEPRLKPVKDYTDVLVSEEPFSEGVRYIGVNNPAPYQEGKSYFIIINRRRYEVVLKTDPDGTYPNYYLQIPDLPDFTGNKEVYTYGESYVWCYEITYDMFTGDKQSNTWYMPYITKSSQHAIENYAGHLDSHAQNLVNQLDKYSGVIVEPYKGGAKSVRTENLYVRIEEGNMLIPTQYPIYDVQKLEYVYATDDDPLNPGKTVLKSVDITPYVFESSEYDGRLSSYSEVWPYSKVFALRFAQGEKNITGLSFKVPDASQKVEVYKQYAIVNILREATGNPNLFPFDPLTAESKYQYPRMCFRVTYTPFYDARVAQTKPYYKDFKRPAALIFNQQSNVIESRYYGENLKGAIARLGNIDASITYIFGSLSCVPKAGQKFNKYCYISAVAVEVYPTCVKCTVGLSKDFNRLSQYIGISSVKRYYEISQNQAVERNTLYREYIVIGEKEELDEDAMSRGIIPFVGYTFKPPVNEGEIMNIGPITNVIAHGESYSGTPLNTVNLPVISSAFGNSISFSWKYEDNYSAGAVSDYQNDGKVSGYFQNNYRYGDYYGKMYYYHFDLYLGTPETEVGNFARIGRELPGNVGTTSDSIVSTGEKPFIIRKDNREALQINYQIDFVTNIETFIIGSALASYCPAVRGLDTNLTPDQSTAKLYVFPNELNKFTDHVEAFADVDLSGLPSAEISVAVEDGYLKVEAASFPANGKAWAIVTPQRSVTQTVEDEEGNELPQTVFYGGDLLIGQNIEVKSGQAFTPIYFTPKREVFDKSVWKARR